MGCEVVSEGWVEVLCSMSMVYIRVVVLAMVCVQVF